MTLAFHGTIAPAHTRFDQHYSRRGKPLMLSPFLAMTLALTALGRDSVEVKHYLVVFASQADPMLPRWSHTFAAFVKTRGAPDAAVADLEMDVQTISWLPASGAVALRFRREPGRNFELPETLSWAQRQGARIVMWGPFEIELELYALALRRKESLESGAWSYRMLDGPLRSSVAVNCCHALCDLAPGEPLQTGRNFGESASALVVQHLERWLVNPEQTHDWLIERLVLPRYNVQRRNR